MFSQARAAALRAYIKPLAQAKYEVDTHWHFVERMLESLGKDYGGIELVPDYQRGHVWTEEQQQHFIENVMRGAVASSGLVIQLNCPNFDSLTTTSPKCDLPNGVQCVDGLQRLTAVRRFMAGEVSVFGMTKDEFRGSEYDPTRMTFRLKFAIFSFERKVELLDHYLALNAGGTPHPKSEIERVKAMRDELALAA
ncbi:DUF262 domain-containing protein [Paraburkholderia aspalathi]|nr:DUF262 domain-containing protein [Paraburkholderia aspalathi]